MILCACMMRQQQHPVTGVVAVTGCCYYSARLRAFLHACLPACISSCVYLILPSFMPACLPVSHPLSHPLSHPPPSPLRSLTHSGPRWEVCDAIIGRPAAAARAAAEPPTPAQRSSSLGDVTAVYAQGLYAPRSQAQAQAQAHTRARAHTHTRSSRNIPGISAGCPATLPHTFAQTSSCHSFPTHQFCARARTRGMRARTHERTHTRTHIHTPAPVHPPTHTHTHTHTNPCASTHIHTNARTHARTLSRTRTPLAHAARRSLLSLTSFLPKFQTTTCD